MLDFFYRPQNAWAADFIPFYKDGEFHLFYLKDWRNPEINGEGTPWYKIRTKDFVEFIEDGEMIPRGAISEQDLFVYTGCVIEANGKYHIFYTGHNPKLRAAGKPEQAIMHAISDDLNTWEKLPEDTFFAPSGYEPHDWRDPFVFWNEEEGKYWMLIAARLKDSPEIRKGCTAVCSSTDLKTWEIEEPLWAPDMYFTHECPDLFKIGDWWYLIFSEFTDRCITRYRKSKSLKGPWITAENDAFDGRAYYAAKTASNGTNRYIFGWNPTKEFNDDTKGWQWGGNLVVHQVLQNSDGSLACKIPNGVNNIFNKVIIPQNDSIESVPEEIKLLATDKVSTYIFSNELPDTYKFDVSIKFTKTSSRFGIMMNSVKETDNAYCYFFEPHKNKLSFDFWPNHPWGRFNTRECEQHYIFDPEVIHKLTIIVDHTVCVAYLDDKIALSGRMYQNSGGKLGLIVIDGEVEFINPIISTL